MKTIEERAKEYGSKKGIYPSVLYTMKPSPVFTRRVT